MRKLLVICLLLPGALHAGVEFFGKGSYSKSYVNTKGDWIQTIMGSGGFAITIFTAIRLEARYANQVSLQNTLRQDPIAPLSSVKTEAQTVSVGLSLDLLGEHSPFQPYIYLGPGYIQKIQSYYAPNDIGGTSYSFHQDAPDRGFTGNAGLGFRLRVLKRVALEFEAFAYGMNLTTTPQIDISGSAGIRIFF